MSNIRLRAIDVFLIASVGLAITLWTEASVLKPPFDIYPKMVILLVGLLACICLIQNMLADKSSVRLPRGKGISTFLITVGGITIYIVAIDIIGYFVSTFFYLGLFFMVKRWNIDGRTGMHLKGIALDVALAGMVTATVALIFKFGLKLVFPEAALI